MKKLHLFYTFIIGVVIVLGAKQLLTNAKQLHIVVKQYDDLSGVGLYSYEHIEFNKKTYEESLLLAKSICKEAEDDGRNCILIVSQDTVYTTKTHREWSGQDLLQLSINGLKNKEFLVRTARDLILKALMPEQEIFDEDFFALVVILSKYKQCALLNDLSRHVNANEAAKKQFQKLSPGFRIGIYMEMQNCY